MTDNRELPRQIVVTPTKSVGISIILTVLFGPLGMFYSTIWGAIIMLIISGVIGVVTFGYGLMITHPICVIWGRSLLIHTTINFLKVSGSPDSPQYKL